MVPQIARGRWIEQGAVRSEAPRCLIPPDVVERPTLVLYENFAADPRTSTLNILERLGLEAPGVVPAVPNPLSALS